MKLERKLLTERAGIATTTWYHLIGPDGAVQLMMLRVGKPISKTYAVDLSAHSPVPLHDGHTPMQNCDVIKGDCYYVGSTRLADELYTRYQKSHDPETIWFGLEEYYARLF